MLHQQNQQNKVNMNPNQLQQQVKLVLLQQPSIQDCTVLVKKTQTKPELIPYIVSNQNLSLKQLQSYLEDVIPRQLLPKTFVVVSHLPLTDAGDIDEIALSKLPAIDEALIEQAETQLKSIPETETVAAIAQKYSPIIPALHLSDLLSDWDEKSAILTETKAGANSLSKQNQVATELDNLTSKPLALVDGGALPENPHQPNTLPEILQKAAAETEGNGIIYLQADGSDISHSYQELLEQAQRILTGLRKLGLQPQDKVILQLELNQDFIPAFWGCILGGFIPVPVSILQSYEKSHKSVKKLENSWQMLGKPFIFTSAKLAPVLDSLWQSLELDNLQLAVIEDLRNCPPDKNWHNPQPLDLAIMLLTSGSTGTPKCISLSHRNLIDRARGTNILCQNTDKDIILNWLPFDHIGSISDWHIRFIYLGCQLIYVTTEYVLSRALNWLDLIHRYRISHSWAPNFAYALVNDALKQTSNLNWNLSCVKSLLTAGEAVSSRAVTEFIANLKPLGLKDKAIHAAFGMAETGSGITYYCSQKDKTSPIYTIDKSFLKSTIKMVALNSTNSISLANLGQVIPGVQIRIVNEQNSLLPEETIGHLQVKGNAVFKGYYKNSQASQEVFVEDGWFNTGDLGFIIEKHLVITGRAKETIIVNGANYYSHEIEAAVEEITGVQSSYTAAIGARRIKDDTDELVIFFSPSQDYSDSSQFLELIKKIRSKLIQDIGINPDYLLPVTQDIIPKTSIGKIQRSQLKQRFEAGEFENIIKQVDILLGNSNTIPDWFYRKIWRPKKINSFKQDKTQGCTLIFKDELGLGEYLSQELGSDCIFVVRGDKFYIHNNTCAIDPQNSEHYQQLLQFVLKQGLKVDRILHLWTYEPEESETVTPQNLEATLQKGIYSILFLVQALANLQGSKQEIDLLAIANFSQAVTPEEKISPAKSTLISLIKTISQEFPWIKSSHLDLPIDNIETNAEYIIQEINSLSSETEIVYRQGKRLVSGLEKIAWEQETKQPIPLKKKGVYLITGGLGDIGVEIAKYLLTNYQAKLILIGRTSLPPKHTWTDVLAQNQTIAKKIKSYQELVKIDRDIIYQAVDIGNLEELQKLVNKTLEKWQKQLDGIIHLAGVYQDKLLIDETPNSLAKVLHPKFLGTWNLYQLIKNRPQSLFIGFSSVNSFFSGTTAGAYSAANCFFESLIHHQQTQGFFNSYCLSWSMWDEMGMSQGYKMKALSQAQGYDSISSQQGLLSLQIALQHHRKQLLIGLNASKSNIQQYLNTPPHNLQQIFGYFTSNIKNFAIPSLKLEDKFGIEINCKCLQLESLPLTATGEVDKEQLQQIQQQQTSQPKIAPRNELEQQLVTIWQEVLGIKQIYINDDFFELGGTSIQVMAVVNKLQDKFQQMFHPTALFDAPTVELFANYLQQNYAEAVASLLGQEITTNYSQHISQAQRDWMQSSLQSYVLRQTNKNPQNKNKPAIFILSPPRSGSTLLRVILGGHSQLFAPPELYLLCFNNLQARKAFCSGGNSFMTEGTLRAIMQIKNISLEQAQEYLEELENQNLTTQQFYALLQEWLPNQTLVDKTPTYAFNLDILKYAEIEFKNPLYIHLQRHPYATIRSIEEARIDMLLPDEIKSNFSLSLREKAELIWSISHQNILTFLNQIPSERQHSVKYEDLVQNPQNTVEKLCNFLKLDFQSEMLQPYSQKKQRMTDGIHSISRMVGDPKFHTHQKINTKSIDLWKQEYQSDFLSEESWQIAEQLGYERLKNKSLSNLVTFQSQGNKKPLFFIHPIGGNILCYRDLAKHLDSTQPFYALQSTGLDGTKPLNSIPEMAATYIKAIKTNQSEGSYRIGGWSFGGTIAFEMAQQLHKLGEKVELLIMIDTYSPLDYLPIYGHQNQQIDEAQIVLAFARNLWSMSAKELTIDIKEIQNIDTEKKLNYILLKSKENGILSEIKLEQIRKLYHVFQANIQARNSYHPQSYPGQIAFFSASKLVEGANQENSLTWAKLAANCIDIHQIDGDHCSIIKNPILAEKLREYLV